MSSNRPSEKTLELLLEYEVGGGKKYYEKYLSKFTWPGGASGPTIGIGIDTAYYTASELADIFKFLPEDQIKMIQMATGRTGSRGKEYTGTLRKAGITVSWDDALNIFEELTWPKFSKAAEKAFPELNQLHEDAYGAIVSIVFNRGTLMKGDSRKEMRAIRTLVLERDYRGIAKQIRAMKRLWQGKGLDGLITRREAEAKLVESVV
jgi:GH24 family phage-related lysozyme (muramidase)